MKYVLSVLLLSLVAGCATGPLYTALPEMDKDYARLVIYRPYSMQGAAWPNPYCVDYQKVASLRTTTYTWLSVNPGKHTLNFCRNGPGAEKLKFDVNFEGGRTYYLRQGPALADQDKHVVDSDSDKTLSTKTITATPGFVIFIDFQTTFSLIQEDYALDELKTYRYTPPIVGAIEK